MLRIIIGCFILGMIVLSSCESGVSGDEMVLASRQDSISYAHGVSYQNGSNGLGALGISLNPDQYLEGFKSAQDGGAWTLDRAQAILVNFSRELQIRQGAPFTSDNPMQTDLDSLSLALGAYDGHTYQGCGFEASGEAICAGIKEAQNNQNRLSDDLLNSLSRTFEMELTAAMTADREARGEEAKLEGAQFLATNKEKEGVQVTESGLQYKVIESGNGTKPSTASTVVVHYEGRLIDGQVFDSSLGGEPIEFGVTQVIPGWTEGLQLMNQGAKYQFYIPSDLAYGPRGAGQSIGPNETLIFDVELIEVK